MSTQYNKTNQDKTKMHGGGSKPISVPQKNLLRDLCGEHGLNIRTEAEWRFNKELDYLTGAEADSFIKSLLKRGQN